MSRPLPPEILDLVIDQLHDKPTTLKACCLVSKSCISRTRKHLFAHVGFDLSTFESWMKVFPDPSNSPAHHTRSLSIRELSKILISTPAGMDMGRWIRAFYNVVHFVFDLDINYSVKGRYDDHIASFLGFSPTVRSLRVTSTSSKVFDFVCSFPLLEDLALINIYSERDTVRRRRTPSTSPKLTGSLYLSARGGICSSARRLLDLPDGLRFTKITVWCNGRDFGSVTDLVSGCSNTLVSLTVHCFELVTSRRHFPDLSKASKLKDLMLVGKISSFHWVIEALRTVESKNLQQITIHPYAQEDEKMDHQELQNFDRLLVQLWTSHSIRPQLVYTLDNGRAFVSGLVPELTRRGLIDLVKYSPLS